MSQRSVLVIDDSKLHQSFIARVLSRADFDVVAAASALEGLTQLSKRRFDLIILDLVLPDINGLSIARTIREMRGCENLPICVLAAEVPSDTREELTQLGIHYIKEKAGLQATDLVEFASSAIQSAVFQHEIFVLSIGSSHELTSQLQRLGHSSKIQSLNLSSRAEFSNHIVATLPDVLLLCDASGNLEQIEWIAKHYQEGLFQGIPWLLACTQGIPSGCEELIRNRAILPLNLPCSDLELAKSLEILATFHKTWISAEESGLELEIAYAEMEKNRFALTESKSELSQRKSSLGNVLSKIGLEIREPLTTIVGLAQLLQARPENSEDEEECLNAIFNSSQYLSQVVNDILGVSTIERGIFTVQKKELDLLGLLSELSNYAKQRAQAVGISFALAFDNEFPLSICSDPTVLRQILLGLLDNAIKFTNDGTVRLRVSFEQSYNQLSLTVTDTGPGIPAEKIPGLFGGYSASASNSPSGGLGLWYAKIASESIGGELQLNSRVGSGSSFTLTLDPGQVKETIGPEFAQTMLELSEVDQDSDPRELSGSILSFGFYPDNQRLLRNVIKKTNATLEFATTAAETAELALSGKFSFLLTDALASDFDVFSLIRNLRHRGFKAPIVSISACTLEEQRQRCLDVGCDAILDKPFSVKKFFQTVRQLQDKRPDSQVLKASLASAPIVSQLDPLGSQFINSIPEHETAEELIAQNECLIDPSVAESLNQTLASLAEAIVSNSWVDALEIASELTNLSSCFPEDISSLFLELHQSCQSFNNISSLGIVEKIQDILSRLCSNSALETEDSGAEDSGGDDFSRTISELESLLAEVQSSEATATYNQDMETELSTNDFLLDGTEPVEDLNEIDVLLDKLSTETMLDLPSTTHNNYLLLQSFENHNSEQNSMPAQEFDNQVQQTPPTKESINKLEENQTPTALNLSSESKEITLRPPAEDKILSEILAEEPSIAPLVLDFLDELKVLVTNIRLAYSEHNWKELKNIAQEISGSAGICGYPSCAEAAKELQHAAASKSADSVAPRLPELELICERMFKGRDTLKKIASQLPS